MPGDRDGPDWGFVSSVRCVDGMGEGAVLGSMGCCACRWRFGVKAEREAVERADRGLLSIRAAFSAGALYEEDSVQIDELCLRLAPVILGWFEPDRTGDACDWGLAAEGLSMLEHVAYWCGQRDMTPTAVVVWVEALVEVLGTGVRDVGPQERRRLRGVCAEGCARGRADRTAEAACSGLAAAQPCLELSSGCLAVVFSGPLDRRSARLACARFERELLRREARSCILVVGTDTARALAWCAELVALLDVCQSLGIVVFGWLDPALSAQVDLLAHPSTARPTWCASYEQASVRAVRHAARPIGLLGHLGSLFGMGGRS